MRIYLIGVLAIALVSCFYMWQPPEILSSLSGRYDLKVGVNKNKSDKIKYNCILLTLYGEDNKEITTFQTGASNNMKWVVAWHPQKDTIILNSSDIGIYAYRLNDKNNLTSIVVTSEIDSIAKADFQKKYPNR